jgi:hypothetical protein
MNEADYAKAIPPWCGYQTMEGHMNMMLCWSLAGFVERGEKCPYSNCKNCDLLNKDYARSGEPK